MNDSMIYLFEWDDMCEDLTDEEFGKLIRAVSKYAQAGKKSAFSDRMLRSNFKTMTKAVDRFAKKYEAKCEKNRTNGKKGGRPKANGFEENPKKPNGFSENPEKANGFFENPPYPYPYPEPYPNPKPDPEPDRGRGREREAAAPQDTTTTTSIEKQIIKEWNKHDFVQKIKSVDNPKKRWDRTEMAIAVAGGDEAFLDIIRSLDQQAYLKNQPENGYKVIYDWLVQPDTFQALIEGRYKDNRSKYGDDWEVIEFG